MKKKIAIIGNSGHSFCCIEIAVCQDYSILGYYDVCEKDVNPYNLNYLGHEDKISSKKVGVSL